jgi:hypothetical protein
MAQAPPPEVLLVTLQKRPPEGAVGRGPAGFALDSGPRKEEANTRPLRPHSRPLVLVAVDCRIPPVSELQHSGTRSDQARSDGATGCVQRSENRGLSYSTDCVKTKGRGCPRPCRKTVPCRDQTFSAGMICFLRDMMPGRTTVSPVTLQGNEASAIVLTKSLGTRRVASSFRMSTMNKST